MMRKLKLFIPILTGLLTLSKEDIFKVLSVVKTQDSERTNLNVLDLAINNGQTDYFYDKGYIQLPIEKVEENGNIIYVSGTFEVTYDYFEHTGDVGPFIASSYGKDLYKEIPSYRSTLTNQTYKLRDCMDFRVKRSMLAKSEAYYPCYQSDITYNLSIFLPRIDAVWVDKNGVFGITTGIPAEYPEIPEEKNDVLTLSYIYNEAYGNTIIPKYINNQRHTMEEINELDTRLSKVENMLSLTMLEQSAVNMQITDEDGYNRFKSGIFTDGFSSYDNADVENEEWSASIDAIECSIRPEYTSKNIPFVYVPAKEEETTNINYGNPVYKAPVITLPISGETKFVENPYASETFKVQNIQMNTWIGKATITPSVDVWYDESKDISSRAFRDWSLTNKIVTNDDKINGLWSKEQKTTAKNVTNTSTYDGSWDVSNFYSQMETQDTYLQPKTINFELTGMRPNTKLFVYFDGKPLNVNCVTDSKGVASGSFTIPEFTDVGRKLIEFFDANNSTSAYAEYLSFGRTVWNKSRYIRDYNSLLNNVFYARDYFGAVLIVFNLL